MFFDFLVKNNEIGETKYLMKDQGYEDWRLMVLKRFLKTIQVVDNSSHIRGHFKTEEHSKKNIKQQNLPPKSIQRDETNGKSA